MTTAAPIQEIIQRYEAYGGAQELMYCRDMEVTLDGPAGTGKTLAAWKKIHLALLKYPGARALALRKTHASLVATALVTFRKQVLHPADGVKFFSGNQEKPPMYIYPNGSEMLLGGLDNPDKVMSSEYDLIYVNEATDLHIDEWELPISRLRNGIMPYQQLIADVNPRQPKHWLNERMNSNEETFRAGYHKTRRILSRHVDNPKYYNRETEQWTAAGAAYIEGVLGQLTGVRRLRLLNGIWAAAEGLVYEEWDESVNLINRAAICQKREGQQDFSLYGDCGIPRTWKRWLAIDFGFTHPFVCQWFAEDGDGRLYLYREIYHTQRLIKDHADVIKKYSKWGENDGDPLPHGIYADPSNAEGIRQLETHLGKTVMGANNDIETGIQAVKDRMRAAGDGLPRLYILRDSLIARDETLKDAGKPTCTLEELDCYIWPNANSKKNHELPIDDNNHGADAMRYIVKQRSPRVSGRATKIKMF